MIDLLLFIFCSSVLLSFSISLLDGFFSFCSIWLFSIFYSLGSGIVDLPNLVRAIWFTFFLAMLVGRLTFKKGSRIISAFSNDNSVECEAMPFFSTEKKAINPLVLKTLSAIFLVSIILQLFGIGQNQDYVDSVNASSKSLLPYVFNGLSQSLFTFWTLSIILAVNHLNFTSYKRFINLLLPLLYAVNIFNSLRFSNHLTSYATKFLSPFLDYFSRKYFLAMRWLYIRELVKKVRPTKTIALFALIVIVLFSVFSYMLSLVDISAVDLILLKITNRSEVYPLLTSDQMLRLIAEYQGNILYFFHPFLKVVGSQGYQVPMGTFMISGLGESVIGGPNVHLPVVLYVITGGGIKAYVLIFLVGFFAAKLLWRSRQALIYFISNSKIGGKKIFWHIFFFNSFFLFLTEPSAFGHSLFFYTILYMSLAIASPSLFNVIKDGSSL